MLSTQPFGIVVFGKLDVAEKCVTANSHELDDAELEKIVLRTSHVIAALRIHRKAGPALRKGRVLLVPSDKAGGWVDGESLKLRTLGNRHV